MITREPEYFPPSYNFIGAVGRYVFFMCRTAGRMVLLLIMAIANTGSIFTRRGRKEVVSQMFSTGILSLGVITVVAVFTGMILSLQTGLVLRQYNQEVSIGSTVMVTMLREMGPFMTGLILAACVGSTIAAQISTMTVSEEIAALEMMCIDPVRFLVTPRLIAMAIMTPLLSFYTCMMGVIGGGIVAYTQLGIGWSTYIDNALRYAQTKDLWVGMLKAVLFGTIITTVACDSGFTTSYGAVGVGSSTRKAVVVSFLLILITGYFVTTLFYL